MIDSSNFQDGSHVNPARMLFLDKTTIARWVTFGGFSLSEGQKLALNNSEQVKLSPEMVEQIQHSTNEHLNSNGYEPFRIQDGCLISSCS